MTRDHRPWAGLRRGDGLPRAGDEPAANSDEVTELLNRVRALRLTLTADLSAAASALDAEQPDVARDIIAADSLDVQRLGVPVAASKPRAPVRSRRLLLALPAIPLVGALAITGAAALTSNTHRPEQLRPTQRAVGASAVDTPTAIHETAATTLHQLERVVAKNRQRKRVVAVATHLHRQLSAIIATSPHSAQQLGEVRRLLSVEQQLLETHHGDGTAIALAASRKLTHLLSNVALPTSLPTALPTKLIKPATSPTPKPKSSQTTKPDPATGPTSVITAVPTPTNSSTSHHHHHHSDDGITDPLLGTGLFDINS